MSNASPPSPYHFLPGRRRDVLLLCDHASNAMPTELRQLGLSDADAQRHIAWDIGAAGLTTALAKLLDAPAFFGGVSRLVADLNRAPDAPEVMLDSSEDTPVPGNRALRELDIQQRIVQWHHPYHHAISQRLTTQQREGERPALISIHSFTPVYHGRARPWEIGVLWKHASPWLSALFAALHDAGHVVGDNQPYDGSIMLGYTLETHAIARDLRHVLFEIRQDLLQTQAQQDAWARQLAQALIRSGLLSGDATLPV